MKRKANRPKFYKNKNTTQFEGGDTARTDTQQISGVFLFPALTLLEPSTVKNNSSQLGDPASNAVAAMKNFLKEHSIYCSPGLGAATVSNNNAVSTQGNKNDGVTQGSFPTSDKPSVSIISIS